jgi:excisionase family DNA binding protein
MEALKSAEEAAELWGLSAWTVRAYVRQGKINPVRIGRRVLIEPCEIARVIEAGRRERNPEQAANVGNADERSE